MIRVRDSGQGVAPELVDCVFEPFFTTKAAGQGTGLGLAQVFGFCARARGTASFDSVVGEGATVRLYLPAAAASAAAPSKPPPAAAMSALPLRGVRVMLVEDNAEVAFTTGTVLESMGCLVRQVENAGPATEIIDKHPHLPMVMISGYATPLGSAAALGVAVLPKPCTPEALLAVVRTALARQAQIS